MIEVDVGMKGIFLTHFLDQILTICIGVRISKSKFDPIFLLKLILKTEFRLIEDVVLHR